MSTKCKLHFAILAAFLLLQEAVAQIPTACADADSLENLRCCPSTDNGVCGGPSQGSCVMLDVPEGYSSETSDVRVNWPHYYTQGCRCTDNYQGYDCSRCKFGFFGDDCSQSQVLPRRPLRDFTEDDWTEYIDILRKTRDYDSGYVVVLEESVPGNASLVTSAVSLYGLYIWRHHYSAKDSLNPDPGTCY